MSLHYLVKLSVRGQFELRKTQEMFMSHRLQNRTYSDNILYLLS